MGAVTSSVCVELRVAMSEGESEKEALQNIREAIELVLEELGPG